ncbi:ATP-binding cassette domain-containing protein [Caviibacter abscessus]|uniref:ATP-binding cassette domain-containing protein n=1 Tax=Caviibacter abscessus TaxID=1766719 RepID=UPI00082EC7F8|nr:ATP-binding cassette domain-containing protein [Caviibacter abscessus]
MNKICIENLDYQYKKFQKKAVDNICLEIKQGVYGLVGANGAGKTTLLKIIATLLPFNNGKIVIGDLDMKVDLSKIRSQIGYVPQKFEFFEMLTVYEFLYYIGLNKKISSEDINQSIEYWLEKFNLINKKNEKIKTLSGGMKQRIAIIQAILGDPKILIFDEPTVGLDPMERLRFKNIINEIKKDRIIIISTHIISDVSALCDMIGVMSSGKILYSGTVDNLIDEAKGKISTITIKENDNIAEEIMNQVISIKRFKDNIYIKIIDTKGIGSSCVPDLEDAYFLKIKEKELNI